MSKRHLRVIPVYSFKDTAIILSFIVCLCVIRKIIKYNIIPHITQRITQLDKTELRRTVRNRRRSLSAKQQVAAACGLLVQLQSVPAFLTATKIAMYLVNDGEIDPIDVMKWCWSNSKQTYIPIVVEGGGSTLLFANVNGQTEYAENRFDIREPLVEPNQIVSAQHLDLVLMPLVAFDQKGNRVGMGGGFYDSTFAFLNKTSTREHLDKPQLIGIAHEIQKVEGVSAEHWDIPLTTVVTDQHVYRLG